MQVGAHAPFGRIGPYVSRAFRSSPICRRNAGPDAEASTCLRWQAMWRSALMMAFSRCLTSLTPEGVIHFRCRPANSRSCSEYRTDSISSRQRKRVLRRCLAVSPDLRHWVCPSLVSAHADNRAKSSAPIVNVNAACKIPRIGRRLRRQGE